MWHALQSRHRHFAISCGDAARYPADVAPFAAVAEPTTKTLRDLHSLMQPAESLWIADENIPPIPELDFAETMPCLQMILAEGVAPPDTSIEIVKLSDADAPDMVALTAIAFPRLFRPRTCEMGTYYGVRDKGELIAMGGERFMLDGYPEISGVCTHPGRRGEGLATSLIAQLMRDHRRASEISWLHVGAGNQRAIDLYLGLGFEVAQQTSIVRVVRRA